MFDYEVRTEYSFFLEVEDNGRTSQRLSENSVVNVAINNVDDVQTVFDPATYSKCMQNLYMYDNISI